MTMTYAPVRQSYYKSAARLMTDTYTVIREESEQVWRKDRAMFTDPALV